MENAGIWQEQHPITASMVNTFGECKLDAICNILQEVAGRHANARKIGFFELKEKGLFWALSRLRIKLYGYANWQDTITVQTWVHKMRGPISYRNFNLTDAQGKLLASACTLWSAVDVEARRPARIAANDFPILTDRLPGCGEPEKLKAPTRVDRETTYTVRYSDLDMVEHVNNVRYLTWLIDTYGRYNLEARPTFLEINYLGETGLGDSVLLQKEKVAENKHTYRHRIIHAGKDDEVLRAYMEWQDRK